MLDLAGIENISPFYNFEDGLRKELPIARDDSFMLPDRTYSNSVPDTVSDELNLLKQWSYYKVFESK